MGVNFFIKKKFNELCGINFYDWVVILIEVERLNIRSSNFD